MKKQKAIHLKNQINTTMRKLVKRLFDLFLSFLALILFSPILIILILILLFTGEHEVFYPQNRIGYLNKPFKIIKFATMMKDSPNMGTGSITLRNDPRVTKIGKFLRSSKLNELPQIFNVIFGQMSMIGPRPQMMADFIKFPEHIQHSLYNVKPGITGIGSIIFRDEEKWISNAVGDKHEFYKDHIAPHKGELELWYQKHLSFYTDFMLIFLTAWVIISPKSDLVYVVFKDLPERPKELK
jgi:lipopolysaccharide/colanic/teichoic acid biosynthesis glycosyltransferase